MNLERFQFTSVTTYTTSTTTIEPMIPSESGIERSQLSQLTLELERKAARLAVKISSVTAKVLEKQMCIANSLKHAFALILCWDPSYVYEALPDS